ncbi:pilus assembly protein [Streptomyces zinciresistens]|nr:pilus assembly protein [Streptomyces zinciresistens]
MLPLIVVTLVLLWQCVLVGYTFTLAGNAADEAARAGAVASPGEREGACRQAALDELPDAWSGGVDCGARGGLVTAEVTLRVPVLFPGAIGFPLDVRGRAGAVEEEKD